MDASDEALPEQPPADPEEWTDEQWLDWLVATDSDADQTSDPRSVGWGRATRSAPGQVLGQAMLGLARAMYGRQQDEIVIVAEGDGAPGGEDDFTVHLDPEHPEESYVVFRRGAEAPDFESPDSHSPDSEPPR